MGSLEAEKDLLLPADFLLPVSITYGWSFMPGMAFTQLPGPAPAGPLERLLGKRGLGSGPQARAALSFHGSEGTCLPTTPTTTASL